MTDSSDHEVSTESFGETQTETSGPGVELHETAPAPVAVDDSGDGVLEEAPAPGAAGRRGGFTCTILLALVANLCVWI